MSQSIPQASLPQAPVLACRFCGSVPAAKVTFRAHRGMIIVMQFRSLEGPFCRDCGRGAFRQLTADTMWQGWWGLASFFITPIILLLNAVRIGSVNRLDAPRPNPWGPSRPPMDPGKPLMRRPGALVGLVPLLVFLFLVLAILYAIATG